MKRTSWVALQISVVCGIAAATTVLANSIAAQPKPPDTPTPGYQVNVNPPVFYPVPWQTRQEKIHQAFQVLNSLQDELYEMKYTTVLEPAMPISPEGRGTDTLLVAATAGYR